MGRIAIRDQPYTVLLSPSPNVLQGVQDTICYAVLHARPQTMGELVPGHTCSGGVVSWSRGPIMASKGTAKGGRPGKEESGHDGEEKFTFFYGSESPFSQHHPCEFEVDGVSYNCAEQYMMHQKAGECGVGALVAIQPSFHPVLFGDDAMATSILQSSSPKEQKSLGRKVKNFDDSVWKAKCKDIVRTGSRAKVSTTSLTALLSNPRPFFCPHSFLRTMASGHPSWPHEGPHWWRPAHETVYGALDSQLLTGRPKTVATGVAPTG